MAQQPRIHHPHPLIAGQSLALDSGAARHVQVLRMQPGGALTLFDGTGGQFDATVTDMGRRDVTVTVGQRLAVDCEPRLRVQLLIGLVANDRMDWLVEKATELGVDRITPLLTERSVLRLSGERADKKRAHWQGVAIAACEQSGRNRVPAIDAVLSFADWAKSTDPLPNPTHRTHPAQYVLSLSPAAAAFNAAGLSQAASNAICLLSGPEGGLSADEEARATTLGFAALSLGPRVLRAETAPLAALSALILC